MSMLSEQQKALHEKDPRYDLPGTPKPATRDDIRAKERQWGRYLDADHRDLLQISDGLRAFCGFEHLFSLADSAPGSKNWKRMKAYIEGASLTPEYFGAHSFDQLIPVIGSDDYYGMTIAVSHSYFTDEPGVVFELAGDGPTGIGQYPTLMDAVISKAQRYQQELANVNA
ncbi:SMI1/KNR4 family protein [Mycobacteroides sp. LB1]|uniref:SMI1/KNR4 family protein n=1 Tax=Mycobacteroides sp. LB1 TaxID=2750814 RepID=UPI0015DEB510|nr:SMI1/KNR4 family protein [Mycobacteroides sp. LB1]